MKTTTRLAVLSVAVLAALVFLLRGRPEPVASAAAAPTAGDRLAYRVSWSNEVGGQRYLLDADLELVAYQAKAGEAVVGLRFTEVRSLEVHGVGEAALPAELTRDMLSGHELLAGLAADGSLSWVRASAGATPMFRDLARGILLESRLVEGAGDTWQVEQQLAQGQAAVRYRRGGDGRVVRTRERYLRLAGRVVSDAQEHQGEATFVVQGGRLAELEEHATLIVRREGEPLTRTHSELHLVLRTAQTGASVAPPLAGSQPLGVDPTHLSEEEQAERLEERVAGLEFAELVEGVSLFGHSRPDGARNPWLWRATGLLIRDPARCAELVPLFGATGDRQQRSLIMDLLASAGTPAAQAAMREILAGDAVSDPRERVALLQRFSLVSKPEATSLAFLADGLDGASGDLAMAGAYALGAATFAANQRDPELARPYAARLLAGLDEAEAVEDRVTALRALGNAGLPESLPRLTSAASDEDARVRAASAAALRKLPGEEVSRALVGLAGDASPEVQRAAISALSTRFVTGGTFDELGALARAGRFAPAADRELLRLAQQHDGPGARALLEAVRDRPGQAAATRRRAEALLTERS